MRLCLVVPQYAQYVGTCTNSALSLSLSLSLYVCIDKSICVYMCMQYAHTYTRIHMHVHILHMRVYLYIYIILRSHRLTVPEMCPRLARTSLKRIIVAPRRNPQVHRAGRPGNFFPARCIGGPKDHMNGICTVEYGMWHTLYMIYRLWYAVYRIWSMVSSTWYKTIHPKGPHDFWALGPGFRIYLRGSLASSGAFRTDIAFLMVLVPWQLPKSFVSEVLTVARAYEHSL